MNASLQLLLLLSCFGGLLSSHARECDEEVDDDEQSETTSKTSQQTTTSSSEPTTTPSAKPTTRMSTKKKKCIRWKTTGISASQETQQRRTLSRLSSAHTTPSHSTSRFVATAIKPACEESWMLPPPELHVLHCYYFVQPPNCQSWKESEQVILLSFV